MDRKLINGVTKYRTNSKKWVGVAFVFDSNPVFCPGFLHANERKKTGTDLFSPRKLFKRPQMHSSSKVVKFPADFEHRLQSALDDQARGDCSGALKTFIALIDDGCSEASAFAGVIYEIGCPDVEKDYQKARFYYERAIEQHKKRGRCRIYNETTTFRLTFHESVKNVSHFQSIRSNSHD